MAVIELQMNEEQREVFYDIPEERAKELMSIKMLEHNKIPGLLPVYQQHVDDQLRLSYEIRGRISLQKQYEHKEISVKKACRLIKMVLDIILAGEQFFMLPEEYCVDVSYIYPDWGQQQVHLCYLPDVEQVFSLEFRRLLEYLMEHLDHSDKQAVSFYYAFYDMYCADELSLIELVEHIRLFEEEKRPKQEKVSNVVSTEITEKNTKYTFSLYQESPLLSQQKNPWAEILPMQLTFSEGKYMVGRQEGSAVYLLPRQISRNHAEIEIVEGQAYITDQDSQNGTYVNGRRLSAHVKTRLQSGDKIRFADISYQFSSPDEKSADAISPQWRNKSLHIPDIAGSLRQRFPIFR